MSVDTIGNFLTIIRNALRVSKRNVSMHSSRLRQSIAKILKDEGFIKDYKVETSEDGKNRITIFLKYVDGESVIHELVRISKPSRRNYTKLKDLEPVIGGLGISILSTDAGLITDKQARKLSVGGEVICRVW